MPPLSSNQEIFDVVDEHDQIVGQRTRGDVHREKLLHRAVHIFVFNSDGQLYIQRRSPNKDQLPNCWTSSCSGHVDSGEDYDTAAIRELGEELAINLENDEPLKFLFKHDACRKTGWEFVHIYSLLWDGPVVFDPEEISEGQWIEPKAMENWIGENRRDFAPSFRLLWEVARERSLV
ncbi:NUDIX hydrolase [Rubellicoccus peritrichatus]|uniref:NUDIX domain-containing protein n=1 Tax=Rubellicoccus peritrichatus TaxID=3080537 RepID=A0AAQ3L8S0_9BACT|nr:NUDIX domain-containing protein [Puniceicoccus sp. CR14]WOO41744.1 NUDIX domain-containing protein [Puniceicoccus sp. CR14]